MKNPTITFLDLDDIKNPLLAAGQARATYEVGKRLSKMGFNVVSLCSKYPGYKDRLEDGIKYTHIGINTQNIKINNALYILVLPFYTSKLKSDIIVECFTAPISCLFTPLFTKKPVVALPTVFAAKQFSEKYKLPFTWFEAAGCKLYKYFMPYIKTDLKLMHKYNKNINWRIIPQGVAEDYFKIKGKKRKYILYLGRLDINQKGLDLLLNAYSLVKNKIPYSLVIAGGGPDEDKLKKLITKLKLEKYVKMTGKVDAIKKYEILSGAAFIAFPSRYDNLPLTSIEAIAAGLPIVAFSIPEFSWLSPKFSFRVKPFSIRKYADILLKASTSNKLPEMRKYARKFAKKFKWSNVAMLMADYFNYIIKTENENTFS